MSELLDQVRSWYERFIAVGDESDLDIMALWTVHTWLCEETYTTPRLLIDSAVPGSGKTTLLEHLGKLTRNPLQMAAISSSAMLGRISQPRTLLIDEADRSLNPKRPGVEELVAILNSGYKLGGSRPVLIPDKAEGWVLSEKSTFNPVAIAGNTPLLPDDTRSRCITVRLLPALEGEVESSDWEYLDSEANELAKSIGEVSEAYREQVRLSRPELPKGCVNRLRERWNPLKRIAHTASADWSNKVDLMIIKDMESVRELAENGEAQVSPNLQLARDLFTIYNDDPGFIATTSLVLRLIKVNPEQWSVNSFYGKDLTAQRLGRLVNKAFGINSKRVGDSARGYHSKQFERIWRQLGIARQVVDGTDGTDGTDGGAK
jgi:hypothetical protein